MVLRYYILDLEGEAHSILDLWTRNLQACKDNIVNSIFSKLGRTGNNFWPGLENLKMLAPHIGEGTVRNVG